MTVNIQFVPPRIPFVDLKTGEINRPWEDFLRSLFTIVGGGSGVIDHATLANLNSAVYTHLSAVNATDLIDGGDTLLHFHASDRNSANFTGTNWTDLTDAGDSALHFHASDRARANHTGTQLLATISDAGTMAGQNANNIAVTGGYINGIHVDSGGVLLKTNAGKLLVRNTGDTADAQIEIASIATGTPDGTKFVRDDGTLAVPAGGGGGSGDVVGPASATDNAIARFDATTGKLIQNSGITIADGASGALSGTNTGDQTSIVGITGTKAEFDTACSDGNFLYSGDAIESSQVSGTTTNDNAAAGVVGEYIESVVDSGSAISLTNGVAKDITSISLTAGDWDVSASIGFLPAATTSITNKKASVSLVSNTRDSTNGRFWGHASAASVDTAIQSIYTSKVLRFSLSSTTTLYLVAEAVFSVSTMTGFGSLSARRVR